jgi:hypothetical protein
VQNAPRVVHVFWPFSRQPPSTRSARLVIDARSLPAPGSDHPWHHRSSAAAMRGRRASCSGFPNSNSVGARRKMPFWVTRCGAPAA